MNKYDSYKITPGSPMVSQLRFRVKLQRDKLPLVHADVAELPLPMDCAQKDRAQRCVIRKKLRLVFVCLLLVQTPIQADWDSVGGQFSSFGGSIWSGLKSMAAGFTGAVPSGYYYSFRVFNGSTIPINIEISKVKNIMGARWAAGTGTTDSLVVGADSGPSTFNKQDLYFSINISGGGLGYSDDHYTLGQKNDPNMYYYHAYTAFSSTGSMSPQIEMLGAGFTTSTDFSCRIENRTGSTTSVQFNLMGPGASGQIVTRTMIIPDLDGPIQDQTTGNSLLSFNYLKAQNGYTIRSDDSQLGFATGTIIVAPEGIAQSTGTKKKPSSNPCTYNYVVNGSGAFETGLGPGNFDQPQITAQLRDISPMECQFYNESASQTDPIGTLQPYDIQWQSVWYVYSGYGWSEEAQGIVQYPCGIVGRGQCVSTLMIRPSASSVKAAGPARLYMVRLNVPENVSGNLLTDAQNFLQSLVAGGTNGIPNLSIAGLFCGPGNQTFLTQSIISPMQIGDIAGSVMSQAATANAALAQLMNGRSYLQTYPGLQQYQPGSPIPVYPPLSKTYLGQETISPQMLTAYDRSQILGTELPDSVGLISDLPRSRITGYVLTSDLFYPYGMSSGPFYYLTPAPYLDLSQLYSAVFNYAAMTGYQGISSAAAMDALENVLTTTILGWVTDYVGKPEAIKENIALLLVLLAQQNTNQVNACFGGSEFVLNPVTSPAISDPVSKLSAQGQAFLKMLLYGPVSVSQLPVYNKVGSMYFSLQPGWPAVTLYM